MAHRDITLSDGRGVRVYAPPEIKIHDLVARKWVMPKVPIVEEENKAGRTIAVTVDDDPDYLAECERIEVERVREIGELRTLFTFRDEQPPENWDAEAALGETLRYADPDWQPRAGEVGRKLDWIEWDLLANPADAILVANTLNKMLGISLEVADQVEATFPGPVEEPAA